MEGYVTYVPLAHEELCVLFMAASYISRYHLTFAFVYLNRHFAQFTAVLVGSMLNPYSDFSRTTSKTLLHFFVLIFAFLPTSLYLGVGVCTVKRCSCDSFLKIQEYLVCTVKSILPSSQAYMVFPALNFIWPMASRLGRN